MKRRFFVVGLVGLLLGLMVGLGWELRSWRKTQSARAVLVEQRARLQAQLSREERTLAELRAGAANEGQPAAPAIPDAVSAVAETSSTAHPSSYQEWLEDPKVQVLYLASRRADLAQSYGPFFQTAGLSSEQIEKLSDLLIKHLADVEDVGAVREARGASFDDPEIKVLSERALAEFRAGKLALLGFEGVRRLEDYERAVPVWTYVGKVAGAAALENIPLDRQQAKELAGMMADASASYRRGGQAQLSEVDWKAVQSRASAVLSSGQMKLLQGEQQGRGSSPSNARFSKTVIHAIDEMYPERAEFGPNRSGAPKKVAPTPGP